MATLLSQATRTSLLLAYDDVFCCEAAPTDATEATSSQQAE
jgi:hypothetical protein